jgi:hypothetical protein
MRAYFTSLSSDKASYCFPEYHLVSNSVRSLKKGLTAGLRTNFDRIAIGATTKKSKKKKMNTGTFANGRILGGKSSRKNLLPVIIVETQFSKNVLGFVSAINYSFRLTLGISRLVNAAKEQ